MLEAVPPKGHAGPHGKRATDVGSIKADVHACHMVCGMPSPIIGPRLRHARRTPTESPPAQLGLRANGRVV